MVYKDISELPESVRKVLPESAQRMFMDIVNNSLKEYNGDEAKAFATAWSVIGKKYEKGKDGIWQLRGNYATFAIEMQGDWNGMDWIPVAKVGQKTKMADGIVRSLTKEALQNSVGSWNGGRITKDHNELVVGLQITNAKFEEPFLYMQFDPKTLKYVTCAKASGRSVEFMGTKYDDSQVLDGYGVGLSVLFPPKTPACDKAMGCFENNINLQETEMTEIEELKAKNIELTANFEKKAAEVQTLQDELASSKARLAEFEKKEAEHLKAEIKADFEAIVASGKIPAGKIHDPKDREALEAMFEKEPRQFAKLLASFKQPEGTKETGAEFQQVGTDDDDKEDAKAAEELREVSGMSHRRR